MTIISPPTKSEIFTVYNTLRAFARKNPHLVDPTRVNKALGLLQSKAYWTEKRNEYLPTENTCYCKDAEYAFRKNRKHAGGGRYQGPCKHSIAEMMLNDIIENRKALEVTQWIEQREALASVETWYTK